MFKRSLFFLLAVVLLAGCRSGPPSSTVQSAETQTGQSIQDDIPILLKKPEQWGDAPNFMAAKVGGGNFQLSSLKGKVILLNFWSVDCPACKLQIPVLKELYGKYAREELEIVGVCLEREAVVRSFNKSADINYVLILANQEIASKYGRELRFLPFTLIIDKQGNIAERCVGFRSADMLNETIKRLLQINK